MSDISAWTTSATSNSSVSPDGFPEGMPPGGFHDAMREVQAAVRRWANDPDFFNWGLTPTRSANKVFTWPTVSGTDLWVVGRALRFRDAGAKNYGYVKGVTFTANTAVTVTGTSNLSTSLSSVAIGLYSPIVPSIGPVFPAGCVIAWAGVSSGGLTTPIGWLLCDGSAVSRTVYARLFTAISTTFGVGDGATTFNIPDLRGRAIFGKDDMGGSVAGRITANLTQDASITATTLGATGGSELMHGHAHTLGTNVGATAVAGGSPTAGSGATGSTGSGGSQNMPPAIILNYLIKI